MEHKFINRVQELEQLNTISNKIFGKNVLFIKSTSGIGKSSLTKEFCIKHKNYPCIKIEVNNNNYDSGYYLYLLAQQIDSIAINTKKYETIGKYLFEKGIFEAILETGKAVTSKIPFVGKGTDIIIEQLEKNEQVKQFFNSYNNTSDYANMVEYIKNALYKEPFILNIENIQAIDPRSYDELRRLLSDNTCPDYLLVLEYTDDYEKTPFVDIYSEWKNFNDCINLIVLNKLEKEQIKEVFDERDSNILNELDDVIIKSNGNIKAIQGKYICLKNNLKTSQDGINDTATLIGSLNSVEKFILIAISTYKEKVKLQLIKNIYELESITEFFNLEIILEKLVKYDLIEKIDSDLRIKHDYINSVIDSQKQFKALKIQTIKFWLNLFLSFNDSFILSNSEILSKKLQFASILNDNNLIYSSLNEMKNAVSKSIDPKDIFKYVQKIIIDKDIQDKSILDELNFWLAEVFHSIGDGYSAWLAINEIKNNKKKKHIVLKAIILQQIDENEKAIKLCDSYLKNDIQNNGFELSLLNIKLVALFCKGKIRESREIFDRIITNKPYSNLFEYGFTLRNAEFFFSYMESLKYYEESIKHFSKFDAKRQIASSSITHALHLALIGCYDKAIYELKQIEKEAPCFAGILNMVYNNQAAIMFHQENISEAMILLKKAMKFAYTRFDTFILMNNILACITFKNEDGDKCISNIMQYVEKYRGNLNDEIIKYAYINIYKYFKSKNNLHKASEFLKIAESCKVEHGSEWDFWIYNKPVSKDDKEYYRANIGYPISFNCNYGMEFDSDLMQY